MGVDVGITSFLTTSNGHHEDNPRWARSAQGRLESAQQTLARKKPGSSNRRAARETLQARHRKVANRRRRFHYQSARKLVASYDLIVVEDLKIKNMVRRAKPRPNPDKPGQFLANGQGAKSGLNRSIHDAGWGAFVNILKTKAEEAGRRVIDVDPRHSSDRCEACGRQATNNRISQAVLRCQKCGHEVHADEHAARSIPPGRTGPSGSRRAPSCLKRSWPLQPSEKSLLLSLECHPSRRVAHNSR